MGLLEVVWKVIEHVINAQLKCIPLYDALHGFRSGCNCSTSIIEVKLAQQLGSLEQCSFYEIFLDSKKVFDTMVQGRYLYRDARENAASHQQVLAREQLVCRAAGFYGRCSRQYVV